MTCLRISATDRRLLEHLRLLIAQVSEVDEQVKARHPSADASRRLEKIPVIGPITVNAIVATLGDANNFGSGRQLAAWLGIVPRQHSSGGKPTLLGVSKRGDPYLRTMLIHGARSVIYRATQRANPQNWVFKVTERRNKNVAAVAVANKNARIVWAFLAHNREFHCGYSTPVIPV